jgi:hypothetical protein
MKKEKNWFPSINSNIDFFEEIKLQTLCEKVIIKYIKDMNYKRKSALKFEFLT